MGTNEGKGQQCRYHGGRLLRPPQQDEEADEIFYQSAAGRNLTIATLVLMRELSFPDVCWKYSTAERKGSRRFLSCADETFLTQLVREPAREGAPCSCCLLTEKDLWVM